MTALTSAEVLDTILQADTKREMVNHDPWLVAGLVKALRDVLNPQARICSFGQDRHITREDITEAIAEFVTGLHVLRPHYDPIRTHGDDERDRPQ